MTSRAEPAPIDRKADRQADRLADSGGMRPRVLFVDDDPNVLDGLRVALRRRLRSCELLFAPGAHEALELLDSTTIDLVVADLRMPHMSGLELLEQVRLHHPDALRYVLSGESQPDLVMEAVPLVHRWMAKPFDCEEIASSLNRALIHRRVDLNADAEARRALSDCDALPSPPRLHTELLGLLSEPDVDIDRVADVVATDPAVTAKVLQWANSAAVGHQPVRSVRAAVARVGLKTLAGLSASVAVFRTFDQADRLPGFESAHFNAYCANAGQLATRLASHEDAPDASLAALLSPVGLLLEAAHLQDRLSQAYTQAEQQDRTLVEVERELFGFGHPELAAHLLSIWGLPGDLVPLVGLAYERPDPDHLLPLPIDAAVQAARLLALRQLAGRGVAEPHIDRLDDDTAHALADWEAALPPMEGDSTS